MFFHIVLHWYYPSSNSIISQRIWQLVYSAFSLTILLIASELPGDLEWCLFSFGLFTAFMRKLINSLQKSFCFSLVLEKLNRCHWKLHFNLIFCLENDKTFSVSSSHWQLSTIGNTLRTRDDRWLVLKIQSRDFHHSSSCFLLCSSQKTFTNRALSSTHRFAVYFSLKTSLLFTLTTFCHSIAYNLWYY